MAYTKLHMTRKAGSYHEMRVAPIGFSWTMFFFGPFVPVIRKDWKMFAILFVLCCTGVGWFFIALGFAFFYNGMFIKSLMRQGFEIEAVENINKAPKVCSDLGITLTTVRA